MREFHYIIVGAGSAGCVLANRLTADPEIRVLLIEAGGSDRHVLVRMPTALSYPMAMSRFNWGYFSDPDGPAKEFDPMVPELALGRGPRKRVRYNDAQLSEVGRE